MKYSHPMPDSAASSSRPRFVLSSRWMRILFALGLSLAIGLLLRIEWKSGLPSLLFRTTILGLTALLVFSIFEQWPKRLPRWLARWVLQVVGIGVSMPLIMFVIYVLSTHGDAPPFWRDEDRLEGFLALSLIGALVAPWAALAALVRQKDALARNQALEFELQRSELERQALDARLHLLQAQVAPHFLFNTLANIQALVDTGSPQASAVLRSLIDYLRAAVPLLNDRVATVGQEVELVRAYLELMYMRIPDRLTFTLHADDDVRSLVCPPTTLLTLVENAVRHGIDPIEEGGRVDIRVERRGERCVIHVSDTGAGFQQTTRGLGTGLTTLRERLQLMFGHDAELRVQAQEPAGVSAVLEMPARERVS